MEPTNNNLDITPASKQYPNAFVIFCDGFYWLLPNRNKLEIVKDKVGTVIQFKTMGQRWINLGKINNMGYTVDMTFNIVDG